VWPPTDQSIESLLVLQPPGEIDEPLIFRPLGVSCDPGQGAPFVLREAGDGQPPILPDAGIDTVGRRRLVRGSGAVRAVRVGLESVQAIRSLKPRLVQVLKEYAQDKGIRPQACPEACGPLGLFRE
jgi:hypothetical protein